MYAGVEAGGTKFVCAFGTSPDDLSQVTRFPTTDPKETIQRTLDFLQASPLPLKGIGIASFGPVDPNPSSSTYGFITSTPKPGWKNTDLVGPIRDALNVPTTFDTDVNGAALGEARWGAGQGLENVLYLTIGTGVGGGAIVHGKPLHGLLHPEMGHVRIPRAEGDTFGGHCPYHASCLEGMATGPSLKARWGVPAETLPQDHPAWTFEAHYLAMAIANFILVLSPERIILGGGVMHQAHLFPMIRERVLEALNGYVQAPAIIQNIETYIVPPGLGDEAGVLGAIALAQLD